MQVQNERKKPIQVRFINGMLSGHGPQLQFTHDSVYLVHAQQ